MVNLGRKNYVSSSKANADDSPPPFKNAAERNSHLMKEEDLDPQSSAAAGFYSGLIGAGLSLIGVLLSVYSLVAGEKSFWLGLSGWLAAMLLAVTLTNLCVKLIKINAKLSSQLTVVKSKSVLLEEKMIGSVKQMRSWLRLMHILLLRR